MSSSSESKPERDAPRPDVPDDDGFPPETDVSTPPAGTDQSEHPDKKR